MKIARDIMTKNPFSLSSAMHIPAAVQMMMSHHISSAPVLDSSGKLLGQVTEIELLKSYILVSKKGSSSKILYDFRNYFSTATTIKELDPIDVVVKAVIGSSSHRVLVLDHQGILVGIISPKDILKFLVGDQNKSGTMVEEMNILQDRIKILKDQLKATQGELTTVGGIVEKSPFMFHSADATGKIVIANEKLHSELGYQPKELIGKSIYDIYAQAERNAVGESLKRLIASDQSIKLYTTYFKKNNTPLRVEVVSSAIRNLKGEFIATSTISRVLDSDSLLRALHGIYDSEEE
jgi:PAS domain S-box-containing protein